jgi:hypothetical protein
MSEQAPSTTAKIENQPAPKLSLEQFAGHFPGEDAEKVELAFHRGQSIEATQSKFALAKAAAAEERAEVAEARAAKAEADAKIAAEKLAAGPRGNDPVSASAPAGMGNQPQGQNNGLPYSATMTLDQFVAAGLTGKYSDGTPYGTPGAGSRAYRNGFAESAKRAKAAFDRSGGNAH